MEMLQFEQILQRDDVPSDVKEIVMDRLRRSFSELEEEASRVKTRLEYLLNSGPAITYSCEPYGDFKTTFMSENVKEILGHSLHDFQQSHSFWVDRIHPEDRQLVVNTFSKIVETHSYSEVYRFKHKDGTYRWMLEEANLIQDEQGKPLEVVGFWTDVTPRKKTEEALRESEEHYRLLSEASFEAIVIHEEGRIIDANQIFAKQFGYEFSKLQEIDGFNLITPKDREYVKERIVTDSEAPYEAIGLKKDNTTFPIEIRAKSTTYLGKKVRLAAIRDLTEQKKVEERLRYQAKLLNFISDAVIASDLDFNVTSWNKSAENIFGWREEEVLGKNIGEVLRIEYPYDDEKDVIEQFLREGNWNGEVIQKHKNGTPVNILASVNLIKDENGQPLAALAVNRDITERKKAEKSLRESEEKYRSFVENFQGIAFRGYEDFSTDLFSGKVEEVTGYSEEDFLSGKINFSQLIHPEDLSQINADVEAFMSSSMRETQREYRIIDKNGIFHWILEYSQKFHDKDKRMGGVYGTIQDITERKKAEEETNKFKTIAEKAGYGVAITDIHGNLLYTNESFAKMHYYTTDEIINKHLSIFHTKKQMKNVERLADQLRQKGSYLAEEVWHKRKDNDIFPTLMNGTLITDEKGIPQFMAATAIDITKRKQAEEALRETEELFSQFMIHLPAAVFIKDKDSQTIFANKYLKDVFGGEKWIGKTAMELFPEEIARKMNAADQKALDEGLQIITEELTDKYNVVNIYQTYKFPIKRKNKDSLLGGISIDITVQKKAEEKLRESEERLSSFMDSATDIIQLFDSNLNYIAVNKAAEKMLNSSREEIIGKNYIDFFPYLKGTDRLNVYKDIIKTGKPLVREGSVQKFVDRSFLIRAFKVGNGLGMIISDITESKQAEEALIESNKRLTEVQNLAKMGFLDWNLKTNRILLSDVVINLYGLDPKKNWYSPDFVAQVVHQDDMNQVQSNLEMAVKGIKKYSIDHRVVRQDGTVLWVHTEAELAHDGEGNPQNLLGTVMDITERKKGEEELRASEEKLRAFMDAAPDNFTLVDSNFNFTDMNLSAQRELKALGFDLNEVIGMNFFDINPAIKETGTYNKFLEVIRTGKPFRSDNMISGHTFSDKYYNLKAFKVGDGLGLIVTDVTKVTQIEELMGIQRDLGIALSSTSNLMEALDHILDATIKIRDVDSGGIYLIDQDTGVLYLSCHMGLSESFLKNITPIGMNDPRYKLAMKGDPIYAHFDQVVPSQIDINQLEEGLRSLGIIPVTFEKEVIAVLNCASHTQDEFSDNTRNSLEAIANQIKLVLTRIRAEEALRESEQRFRTIFNNATDGILLADQESRKFYTSNYMMCQMLGFSQEELKNLSVMDIHPKEDLPYVIDQYEKQSRGEINLAKDIPVKRKDGSIFYADINSSHVKLVGKTFLMGIFRDITEKKRAEKTKEDLEKKRSAFVSMTSHELRTPLTVIKGYADFLDKNIEKIDTIRKAQAIQSISRNVLRLERLIEGVANITQIDEGLFELNANLCDFSKFLKETVRAYKELYEIKFSIQGTLEFESPVFLNVDVDRIRQVLDNLMDNANKQTPEDGTIVLSSTILSNTIQITISDTGVGIDPTNLERIFEQFVSIITEKASGGTGIGLYVSKIICEAHGGALTAYSEGKSQGAIFIIELPYCFK